MNENFINRRIQALEFINESEGQKLNKKFVPYMNERSQMGKLILKSIIIETPQSKNIEQPTAPQTHKKFNLSITRDNQSFGKIISLTKVKGKNIIQDTTIITQNPSTIRQDYLFPQVISQSPQDSELVQPQIKKDQAKFFKNSMKLKAISGNPNQSRYAFIECGKSLSSAEEKQFQWNMNKVEQNLILDSPHPIKTRKVLRQLYKQMQTNQPGIAYYQPDWKKKVHQKSIFNIIIPKAVMKSQGNFDKSITFHNEKPLAPVIKIQNETQPTEKAVSNMMYKYIQRKVSKEVNLSIKESPTARLPLKNLSIQPLNPIFIDNFKYDMGQQVKQTERIKKQITVMMQTSDDALFFND